jgi:hypothetical protein
MHEENKIIFRIAIKSPDRKTLSRLMKEFQLDIGGGGPKRLRSGILFTEAYVPEETLEKLKGAGISFEVIENATDVGRERQKEVNNGDRFEGGKKVPSGLGRKE